MLVSPTCATSRLQCVVQKPTAAYYHVRNSWRETNLWTLYCFVNACGRIQPIDFPTRSHHELHTKMLEDEEEDGSSKRVSQTKLYKAPVVHGAPRFAQTSHFRVDPLGTPKFGRLKMLKNELTELYGIVLHLKIFQKRRIPIGIPWISAHGLRGVAQNSVSRETQMQSY